MFRWVLWALLASFSIALAGHYPADPSVSTQTTVIWNPPINRIAPDPQNYVPQSVQEAQTWALETLGPREYSCLWWIVFEESSWHPDIVNSSGACGLGQAWPCRKLSDRLPYWAGQPKYQLSVWLVPYATSRYGSLCGAWGFWTRHRWW